MSILFLVVCTVASGLLKAQAQNLVPVVCMSSNGCEGDDLGVTFPRGCCIDNPRGLSYRVPGSEECTDCTVLGFFEESFTGEEQAEPYQIGVGYTKVRSGSARQLTFNVRGINGTAREGSDFTVNSAQVTFNAANSSASVTLFQDNIALEPDETFVLELDSTGTLNPSFFIMDTINITITDSDVLNVSFERATYSVDERDGSLEVCLTTNIGHAEPFDAVIEVVMKGVNSPAASSSDFDSSDQTVSFARSDISSRGCAQIAIIDDSLFEGDEQFLLRLRSFSNSQVMIGEISEACVTIREDDAVRVNLSSTSIDVDEFEDDPSSVVCVALEGALARNVSATVTVEAKEDATDPATDGVDYSSTVFTVMFAPIDDQISQEVCIPLPIIDDLIANEADEQFSVLLIDVTPEVEVGNNQTCVTIRDNDMIEFRLQPEDMSVVESNTEVEVCIVLIGALGRDVEVTVLTGPKSGALNQATANLDYVALTRSVTFDSATQNSMMCVRVQIMDDELANELDEQFSVSLVSASMIRSSESCITIVDNDVPEFSLTPLAINAMEGNDISVEVCIAISGSIARNVIVTAETAPKAGAANQATADSDYQSTTITVTFEPTVGSETAEVMCGKIPIIDDTVAGEPDEQFSVLLVSANPVGNFANDADESCITILDDDDDELVCHANAVLVENPSGMLVCMCREGFAGDGITNCTDIDECMMEDICDEFVSCTVTESAYECQCTLGDGLNCINRDDEDTSSSSTKRKSKKTHTMTSGSGRSRSKRSTSRRRSRMSKCTPKKRMKGLCGLMDDKCGIEEMNDCRSYVQCINLPGSFKCECTCPIMDDTRGTKRTRSSTTKDTKSTKSTKKTKPGPRSKPGKTPR